MLGKSIVPNDGILHCTTGQIKYTLTEIEQTHANLLHTHRDRTDSCKPFTHSQRYNRLMQTFYTLTEIEQTHANLLHLQR